MQKTSKLRPIDPQHTALLVIDMQNGFCHPNGAISRGGKDISAMQAVVPSVHRVIELCRQLGCPVLWSLQQHLKDDVTRRNRRIPSHIEKTGIIGALRHSWDAELVEPLGKVARQEDHFVVKRRFSMFYGTDLEVLLRMLGVSHVLVTGVATNECVESTIRDAYFRDYDITVIRDCVAAVHQDLHAATLKNVELYFGEIVNLEEFELAHRP